MQSGITASADLQAAFQTFQSTPTTFALLATIPPTSETIDPLATIPSTSADFYANLSALSPHVKPDEPLYLFLRRDASIISVTYVPNIAPVKRKTLFASSRLTLLKSLGLPTTSSNALFVTDAEELTADGWRRHERHEALAAPLTEEEQSLEGIKEAEARESRGTGVRDLGVGGRLTLRVGEGVVERLRGLGEGQGGEGGNVVVLKMDASTETLHLDTVTSADPSSLSSKISPTDPRYTFYKHAAGSSSADQPILFLYTCPTASKPKERMLYASTRWSVIKLAEGGECQLTIAKRLEASDPSDLSPAQIEEEAAPKAPAQAPEAKAAFARPKRPGRR